MQLCIDEKVMAKAMRLHLRRKRLMWICSWVLLVVAFCCAIFAVQLGGFTALSAGILLLIAFAVVLMSPLQLYVLRWTLGRQFRQMAAQGDDVAQVTVTYDAEQITFATQKSSNSTQWSAFCEYYEKKDLLLLYRNARFFSILPLQQMRPEDIQAIHGHIAAHVMQKG